MPPAVRMGDQVLQDAPHCHAPMHPPGPTPTPAPHPAMPLQIIKGHGLISTPYCEYKYLAKVARNSYGMSTTFAKLRNNVSEREHVCQAIGHDHRIYDTCQSYRDDSNRIWRR